MTITENKVVLMHYTLKNDDGDVMDSSVGNDPMAFIQGIGNLIPGLEKQLEGKAAGEKINATVAPEDGYGERTEDQLAKVPLDNFQSEGDEKLEVGMQVQVESNQGETVALVTEIEGTEVTLDLNHPLAGETLHFEVEIMDVREATPDELSHGHAHGPGGHDH
ncbi:MAG: FKBP-type peptidyl-prolyl cis-trans isomerase SlyD [Bacteroidia bacterium]|jgi:FKBP-type peptidyl-prolyl cis-trans isomerase SlyD